MAKGNLFMSQARGKVGSVVFSRLNGEQITRAYNSKPANPKTYAQAKQRMLFASISQYLKAFRYLVEQGQQGVKTGDASIRNWQSRSLRMLAADSVAMMPNVKGVQYPQLLPISLTNGTLPSLDYAINGTRNSAGDTHYHLDLLFKGAYSTVADLAAMTLGDFYALYPGIEQGAQFTIAALAWSLDYDIFDLNNRAYQAIWAQYVLDPAAELSMPFFVAADNGTYIINPAILLDSWGERFTPSIYLDLIDGKAVAHIEDKNYITDGSGGLIAGSVITSYYNGTEWARSTSPMAIANGWTALNIDAIVATYQKATKGTSSDLYLNQSKGTEQYKPAYKPQVVYSMPVETGTSTNATQAVTPDTSELTINIAPVGGRVDMGPLKGVVIDSRIKATDEPVIGAQLKIGDEEPELVRGKVVAIEDGRLTFEMAETFAGADLDTTYQYGLGITTENLNIETYIKIKIAAS